MNHCKQIVVTFPVGVKLPAGFEKALDALINMACEAYEEENPTRVMWVAGHGGMPNMHYDYFNMSVCYFEVAEREATEKELARRKA